MHIKKFVPPSLRRALRLLPEKLSSLKSSLCLSISDRKKIKNTVRLFCNAGKFHSVIMNQTPHRSCLWENTFFTYHGNADINLGINDIKGIKQFLEYNDRNWWLHIEPQGYIRKLGYDDPNIIKNFSRIYTSAPELCRLGAPFIASPPYVHWHLGLNSYVNCTDPIDYDFITNYKAPRKEVNLSCISSTICDLPGHKERINFIAKIAENNLDFELWGGGTGWSKYRQYKGSAPNKWGVYIRSKYVLAIENEIHPYYWTEKFTDAILAYSMPIYYGSTKISEYFPEGSYIQIDIHNANSIEYLSEIVHSDFYENNFDKILIARDLILSKHNMFAFIDREVNTFFGKIR